MEQQEDQQHNNRHRRVRRGRLNRYNKKNKQCNEPNNYHPPTSAYSAALGAMKSRTHTMLREHKAVHEWSIDNFDVFLKLFESKPAEFILTSFTTNRNKQHWTIELRSTYLTTSSSYFLDLSLILTANEYDLPVKCKCEFAFEGMDKGSFIPETKYKIMSISEIHKYIHFYKDEERKIDIDEDVSCITRKIICNLTIYEEVTERYQIFRPKSGVYHKQHPIVADLERLYNTKENSDVTFIVDNTEIKAHKFVLMNRSAVFLRMFAIDMIEKRENKVIIKDSSAESFKKMLKFLYMDKIEKNFNENDAIELLALANKYQIETLKDTCGAFLGENLAVKNAVKIYLLADQYGIKDLLAHAHYFIVSNRMLDILNTKVLKNNPDLLKIFENISNKENEYNEDDILAMDYAPENDQ